MKKEKIILASSSPRRIEMMRNNGMDPIIISPHIEETVPDGLTMEQSVMFLALKKALSVENIVYDDLHPLIIAADTIVYADRVVGKPKDKDEAFEILSYLRNKMHYVATGVAILMAGTTEKRIFCEVTQVFFRDYTDEEIKTYIATEEPYDKAGGYAIQGNWGKYVDHIDGDFNNVIGFPWTRIHSELVNYFKVV